MGRLDPIGMAVGRAIEAGRRRSFPGSIATITLVSIFIGWTFCGFGIAEAAELRIDGSFVDLGNFDVSDRVQTMPAQAVPMIHVQSDGAWELHLTVLTPPRRTSDGLEHPLLRRLQLGVPTLPEGLFLQQPFQVESGPGSPIPETIEIPLTLWETVLLQHLDEADPAGVYRAQLRCDLTTPQGTSLAPSVEATLEFEIDPWLKVETGNSDAYLYVDAPSFRLETGRDETPIPVRIRGNTPWELRVRGRSGLIGPSGETIPLQQLRVGFLSQTGGGSWRALIASATALSPLELPIAQGQPGDPSSSVDVELPLLISYQLQYSPPVGQYDAILDIEAVPIGF